MNIEKLRDSLNCMVNEHYDTAEMLRFFSFSMTLPRARVLFTHTLHFNMNRRNCWGHVQAS